MAKIEHSNMMSMQRRMERYRLVYVWKMMEGKVPSLGLSWTQHSDRRGRMINIPSHQKNGIKAIQTKQDKSFSFHATMLFNCLPKELRNLTGISTERFKESLDLHLAKVPDQPKVNGLTPNATLISGQASNSLLAWNGPGGAHIKRKRKETEAHTLQPQPESLVPVPDPAAAVTTTTHSNMDNQEPSHNLPVLQNLGKSKRARRETIVEWGHDPEPRKRRRKQIIVASAIPVTPVTSSSPVSKNIAKQVENAGSSSRGALAEARLRLRSQQDSRLDRGHLSPAQEDLSLQSDVPILQSSPSLDSSADVIQNGGHQAVHDVSKPVSAHARADLFTLEHSTNIVLKIVTKLKFVDGKWRAIVAVSEGVGPTGTTQRSSSLANEMISVSTNFK